MIPDREEHADSWLSVHIYQDGRRPRSVGPPARQARILLAAAARRPSGVSILFDREGWDKCDMTEDKFRRSSNQLPGGATSSIDCAPIVCAIRICAVCSCDARPARPTWGSSTGRGRWGPGGYGAIKIARFGMTMARTYLELRRSARHSPPPIIEIREVVGQP
jgi:hypothetical protein